MATRWAAAVALLLAGCSGTPFGDQLGRSFSTPEPPTASPPAQQAAGAAGGAGATPTAPAAAPATAPSAAGNDEPARKAQALPPAPYRITIQLPSADPSAPAEAVTEALRKAGVAFEVDRIERVNADAQATPTPAPAPASTPKPAPAPKPR
jgi:hypothetical protein